MPSRVAASTRLMLARHSPCVHHRNVECFYKGSSISLNRVSLFIKFCTARLYTTRQATVMETQEAETKEIETQEMETQALEDTMTSIRSEVETVFSTDQINLSAAALFDRVVATIDLCLVHDASEKPGSAGRAAVNLKYFNSILVPLNDLKLLHEQPRNVFREIHMGEFTLLGLLSPLTLCTIKSISVGSGGIQYLHMSGQPGVDGVPETALPVVSNGDDCVKNEITETNLANYIPRFSRNRYKLVRRSQIVFREI